MLCSLSCCINAICGVKKDVNGLMVGAVGSLGLTLSLSCANSNVTIGFICLQKYDAVIEVTK